MKRGVQRCIVLKIVSSLWAEAALTTLDRAGGVENECVKLRSIRYRIEAIGWSFRGDMPGA
jgi:hypothetical protein